MTSVTKTFTFDAAHRLSEYDGKCKQLHGHTYTLEVTISGELDDIGMVIDFGEVKRIYKEFIDPKFDHRIILKKDDVYNKRLSKSLPEGDKSVHWVEYNPTAENMAKDIFGIFQWEIRIYSRQRAGDEAKVRLTKIRLHETPTSYAEVIDVS